jgi:transcriptional regulator with XRE-family HTH domain
MEAPGQTRDTYLMDNWDEFGQLLRRLRGVRSLREVQKASAVSDSTLSRYERAEVRPPPEVVAALDQYFDAEGELLQVYNALILREAATLPRVSRRRYTKNFPAWYGGPVWARVTHSNRPVDFGLTIRWGPWRRDVHEMADIPTEVKAVVLCFSKEDDGHSFPVVVTSREPTVLDFGLGDVQSAGFGLVLDINRSWYLEERP